MTTLAVINLWMSCFERQDITFSDVKRVTGKSKSAKAIRFVFQEHFWKVIEGNAHMTVLGIKKVQELKRSLTNKK